jgi:hypothetical protein
MDNSATDDELTYIRDKLLPLYDNGKYDIPSPHSKLSDGRTNPAYTELTNRKKEIKAFLKKLLSETEHNTIVGKRVARCLIDFYREYNTENVKNLRRNQYALKKVIEARDKQIISLKGDPTFRCEICRATKKQLYEEVMIESFDDSTWLQEKKKLEEERSEWVRKCQEIDKKCVMATDSLKNIRNNNHMIPKDEWREMQYNQQSSPTKKGSSTNDSYWKKKCQEQEKTIAELEKMI